MRLPRLDVNILNLDNTYSHQTKLHSFPHRWIDFQDRYPGRYCDSMNFMRLQKELQSLPPGITFIGNGNYHYVSFLLIRKYQQPFSLILFDHHTDMLEEREMISCGSWVNHALKHQPNLKSVIIAGANPETYVPHPKIQFISSHELEDSHRKFIANKMMRMIETNRIYISIDKDVLRRGDAVTNWDHGRMKLQDLLYILERMVMVKEVVGADICGELPMSPADLFLRENWEAVKTNEFANVQILQAVLSASSTYPSQRSS